MYDFVLFRYTMDNEEYESYHRYEKPKEETVEKVSGNEEPAKDAFVNRMMFFYENGE